MKKSPGIVLEFCFFHFLMNPVQEHIHVLTHPQGLLKDLRWHAIDCAIKAFYEITVVYSGLQKCFHRVSTMYVPTILVRML